MNFIYMMLLHIMPVISLYTYDTRGPNNNQYLVKNYNFNDNNIRIYTEDDDEKNKEEKLLTNIGSSIKEYYQIIKDMKASGIFETVDWKSFNDDILYDLCMDGTIDGELAKEMCSPYMKKYQVELLLNDEHIDLDRIINYNNNNNKSLFKIYKS